jgi:hypothetical protein
MEKETTNDLNITIAEYWYPTMMLRWLEEESRYEDINGITCVRSEKTLQQMFQSNLGNQEWRNIPVETEL